jgi:hypothetical protein
MKIAILFSGRIYKYKENYENIMKCIGQGHDVDFFLSSSPELNEDIEDFRKLYNPVSIIHEPIIYNDITGYKKWDSVNGHNVMCMYINRKRVVNALKLHIFDTGIVYDWVISTRLDTYNDALMDYSQFNRPNTLYIPEGYDWGGMNDQMAIGKIDTMDLYMSLADDIYVLMKEVIPYGPETLLSTYLAKYAEFSIERFAFPYRLLNGKFFHK